MLMLSPPKRVHIHKLRLGFTHVPSQYRFPDGVNLLDAVKFNAFSAMDPPMIPPQFFRDDAQPRTPKTICIIGAGPAGLAALKVILDCPQYKAGLWKPTAFEARDGIGGVWLPAPPVDNPPLTPLYDSLTVNLPHPIMAFTSYSFPPSTPVFPRAEIVEKYLEAYAHHFHLKPHIRLKTRVKAIERDVSKWSVQLCSGESFHFDLVLVCSGHYRIPRYPDTPGVSDWLSAGKASHSVWYRHPHDLGNTILVVGAGPSGQDISTEMCSAARTVIYSVTGAASENIGNLKRRGRVAQFGSDGQVVFEDGSTESGIDHCILATGYEMSFPFFSENIVRLEFPPPAPPLPREVYNSSYSIFPLARHMFPMQTAFPPSSLAFMGLLVKVVPFPLLEAQARAIVQAFANPEILDATQEAIDIITRYEELRSEFGDVPLLISKAWHRCKELEQFEYRDGLYKFAGSDVTGKDGQEYMKVPEWEKEVYSKSRLLRKMWVELEARGEADQWVRRVGENGPHEWVALLMRMLKVAEENNVHVEEQNSTKL